MRSPLASSNLVNNEFNIPQNPSKLFIAIQFCDLESLAEVVAQGVDTDHFFKLSGQSKPALMFAVERNNFELVEFLVKHGSSVNLPASNGLTCLHIAAELGSEAICRLLLESRANVNSVDEQGICPLHLAVRRGSFSLVELLISYGADVNRKDNFERSTLHYACRSLRLSTEIVRRLVQQGAVTDEPDKAGLTPLFLVLQASYTFEVVKLLVEGGSSNRHLNKASSSGRTPIHCVVQSQSGGKLKCLEYLLKLGAHVEAQTNKKQTALHLSVLTGDAETVRTLLLANANPYTVDLLGVSPFALAISLNHQEIIEVFIDVGVRLSETEIRSLELKSLSRPYQQSLLERLQIPPTLKVISRNAIFKQCGPFTAQKVAQLCTKELPKTLLPFVLLQSS